MCNPCCYIVLHYPYSLTIKLCLRRGGTQAKPCNNQELAPKAKTRHGLIEEKDVVTLITKESIQSRDLTAHRRWLSDGSGFCDFPGAFHPRQSYSLWQLLLQQHLVILFQTWGCPCLYVVSHCKGESANFSSPDATQLPRWVAGFKPFVLFQYVLPPSQPFFISLPFVLLVWPHSLTEILSDCLGNDALRQEC